VDYEYLTRRMTEERQRAADSENEAARDAHMQLAEHYRAQIARLDDGGAGEAQAMSA
jgi:hypothetical protein